MLAPSPQRLPASAKLGLVGLLVFGVILHLLQIRAPFAPGESNAGSYFACIAKGYRDTGFFAVRGAPFMPDLYGGLEPYLHHPPGGFWLAAMFGADELGLRATTLLAHLIATFALIRLLDPVLGVARALLAGALFLVFPVYYIDIQASQWPFTIAFGLLMLLGFERQQRSPASGWRLLTAATAFLGPWVDWHFGFFCLALLPLTELRAPALRRLAVAWAVSAVSLLLFLWWRHWAAQAPIFSHRGEAISNSGLIANTILSRPNFLDQLRGMLVCSDRALTGAGLLGLALGLPWIFGRAPRFAGALLVSGLLGSLLFGNHVLSHSDFPSMLAPLAATAAAAVLLRRRIGLVVGLAVFVGVAWQSLERVRLTRSPFLRDFGRAATAAARVGPDGKPRAYVVASNLTWSFRYYIDTVDVLILPVFDPALIEQHRKGIAAMGKGLRYLLLRYGGSAGSHWPSSPELEAYLARFPGQRLPELEQGLQVDGVPDALRIVEARLVTIEP